MYRTLLLSLALSFVSSSCSEPLDREVGRDDEEEYSAEDSALHGCSAYSECLAPFDGVPITCTGFSVCMPYADRVVCDGRTTYCRSAPTACSATFSCESGSTLLSCTGTGQSCATLPPLDNKICGGVVCNGVSQYCPPLPGDLECF